MALILREEDAMDWSYKGEGAANLVLSYHGSSPFLIGKVLRIKKVPTRKKVPKSEVKSANGGLALSKNEQLLWRDFKELVESNSIELVEQGYMMWVMGPLLDPKHVDGGICITVSREFLHSIKRSTNDQRPTWRVDAAEVDINCDSALLISDHSIFLSSKGTLNADMCFTVEIKPKCGFLPSSEFIAQKNVIKKSTTRFKMHQLLKLHEGEISQLSGYDPLDLFSGSKDRIYQAITSLFTTPGNNFRVFQNGSLIFGGLGGGMDMTDARSHEANEKVEALLKGSGLKLATFIELIVEVLLKSAVLDKLLAAQKLDLVDIEGAIHLYYNIISEPCIVCKDVIDTELMHQYSFLHSLSLEESLKIVREYLIAATAKDCSLMLSFRHADVGATETDSSSIFLKSCGLSFEYKVNFLDLDLKPLNKMVYYYELDQKIVNYYTNKILTEESRGTSTIGRAED
ncbi:uncharacterized protein A4U43_C02F11010 [Asparagus officinalis]|uniref:Inositol-pentakisphosphate 2-kinase n=1 Tax=Asparagus officinalis TaxID=4686 RepID=A0A5P1FHL8_ASPOF|nr:inositol-pentakisphosphate 2-kinase IPK1-like [Asparagus officinalis]ONK77818.1 uncharacterized protein A4U43_C02F11010 [Asparagus officinalis]